VNRALGFLSYVNGLTNIHNHHNSLCVSRGHDSAATTLVYNKATDDDDDWLKAASAAFARWSRELTT